jgi:ankyrin repeat protein
VTTNLEYYRKQAKALLKAAKSGDSTALARIQPYASELALNTAQLTIAREQGFPSWPRFKQFILESRGDRMDLIAEFISAATSDLSKAETMLGSHPELEKGGFYAALVLGDHLQIGQVLSERPELAVSKTGPENVEALIYVCFSRFAGAQSGRAAGLAQTARVLLDHGADPNTAFIDPRWPDNPLPCLYAATGLNNNADLARALLESGANPNDGESLYHSTEHPDHACVRLLLDYGAKPDNVNVVNHVLDHEDEEGLSLLIGAGADLRGAIDRGETSLHWAVRRKRSDRIVALLLDNGAELDAKRADGRTAYVLAIETGQTATADLLAQRGANTELPPIDRFLHACAAAGGDELDRLLREPPAIQLAPEEHRMLPDLAAGHATTAVLALLAAGVPIDTRGENGATALHWACWKGYADIVKILLERGASLTIEDTMFHGTPAGWFGHGLHNCGEGGGNYAEVARLLIAAGAAMPTADFPSGDAEVDRVLREHGII